MSRGRGSAGWWWAAAPIALGALVALGWRALAAVPTPDPQPAEVTPRADLTRAERSTIELFEEASRILVAHQQGSISLLQRRLKVGYARAARLVDMMEEAGIVGPFTGSKAREILVPSVEELEKKLAAAKGAPLGG